jgi:hypothetical protein
MAIASARRFSETNETFQFIATPRLAESWKGKKKKKKGVNFWFESAQI